MAILKIRTYPDPVLTRPAELVREITPEVTALIDDMAETMYFNDGLGLAAPQVGISKRIFVMDVPVDEERSSNLRVLINPEITAREGWFVMEEGCLSFPELTVEIQRAANVTVEALERDGRKIVVEAEGLDAVCLQHEIDHLDGLVLVDRLGPLMRRFALKEFARLQRTAGGEE